MFIKYILLLVFISSQLFSNNIKKIYYIDSDEVKLNTIVKDAPSDINLFKLNTLKHSKKVKTKDLISLLKYYGYDSYKSKHKYIKFIKKSPVDTSRIELALKDYYKQNYQDIEIISLHVEPRSYMVSIPDEYRIKIKKNNYLQNYGVLSIQTSKKKQIFFNYTIKASISVFISKIKIKKDTELSVMNVSKKRILLEKFRARPYQDVDIGAYQAKHHISDNKILTIRDIVELNLVKRKSDIYINMNRDNIDISFSAKALQNGKLNDIIKVQKSNGKILKVTVTGRNKAEIR